LPQIELNDEQTSNEVGFVTFMQNLLLMLFRYNVKYFGFQNLIGLKISWLLKRLVEL